MNFQIFKSVSPIIFLLCFGFFENSIDLDNKPGQNQDRRYGDPCRTIHFIFVKDSWVAAAAT